MTNAELSRHPIDAGEVMSQLAAAAEPSTGAQRAAGPVWSVATVAETASTNVDLIAEAHGGRPEGAVLVAEFQNGGRGRLDRTWTSPPGAGLTVSLLLRPNVPIAAWGWLPLLAGVALCEAVGESVSAVLKWPNDLMVGPRQLKAAGILVQTGGDAAVVGIGLNVSTTEAELPVPTATSLALAGGSQLDRAGLLVGLLTRFGPLYSGWVAAGGDAVASGLAARYRARCATLGSDVSVDLGDRLLSGRVLDVDESGRLLLRPATGGDTVAVAAGDVAHLRPGTG